jgi:hypothetical protein
MAGDYKVQTIVAHTEGTYFTFLAHDTLLSFKTTTAKNNKKIAYRMLAY